MLSRLSHGPIDARCKTLVQSCVRLAKIEAEATLAPKKARMMLELLSSSDFTASTPYPLGARVFLQFVFVQTPVLFR